MKSVDDFGLAPKQLLAVLNPLKITDYNSTRVTKDIWDDENVRPIGKNGVGFRCCRAIRGFSENPAPQLGRVRLMDHSFDGRRHKNIALLNQQVVGIDRCFGRKTRQHSVLPDMGMGGLDVET